MTEQPEKSLIDEVEATDAGAQGLAAARLAGQVNRLLHRALEESDLEQKDLAEKLGVTQGRVSQVMNGDGNVRIAALARYLRALGYEAEITVKPVDAGVPEIASAARRAPRRAAENATAPADVQARASTPSAAWSALLSAGLRHLDLTALHTRLDEIGAHIDHRWATLDVAFTDCSVVVSNIAPAIRSFAGSRGPAGSVDLVDEEYEALCESND